jgi:hypothetical protein
MNHDNEGGIAHIHTWQDDVNEIDVNEINEKETPWPLRLTF